jgi:hypothetical protein
MRHLYTARTVAVLSALLLTACIAFAMGQAG